MNEFLKNLLNITDENTAIFLFQNTLVDEQEAGSFSSVLTMLQARCGINVEDELTRILSQPKYRRTVNLSKLIDDIVSMVDEWCGCFNPYVNPDMPTADALLSYITCRPDRIHLMQKLQMGKKMYVLCNLELIKRQVCETNIVKILGDNIIRDIQQKTKRKTNLQDDDQEQEDSSDRKIGYSDEEKAGYLYRKLRDNSRTNFVSVLLSSEQMRRGYIKNYSHLQYEYVMATKSVRIAGLLSPNNVFNKEQDISHKKYCGFVARYHEILQASWKEFQETGDKRIQCTDRYLSEVIYGFELVDDMLCAVSSRTDLDENVVEYIAKITAQLIQIPDLSARKLYAEMILQTMLVADAKNDRMNMWLRSDLFIQFESKVYYPILMTCVLKCLYMVKSKRGYDIEDMLKETKMSYRFHRYFDKASIMDEKKQPFVASAYADTLLNGFYQTVKENYYNKEGFTASIGRKCYDMHLSPQQMLKGMQYALCSGNAIDPAGKLELPPVPQDEYYIADKGKSIGPYELKKLKQMLEHGEITRDTLVFKKGTDNWKRAERFEELAEVFEAIVPEIPSEMS